MRSSSDKSLGRDEVTVDALHWRLTSPSVLEELSMMAECRIGPTDLYQFRNMMNLTGLVKKEDRSLHYCDECTL